MEWKYSSLGIRSLSVGISSLACGADALLQMKIETQNALRNPNSAAWHDGSIVIDAAEAVDRLGGHVAVEEMNHTAAAKSLGPVIGPFVKVSLALFGASPATTFSRMNDSLMVVMKGVRTQWHPADKNSGRLTIFHGDIVAPVSWPCWRGALRFSYDLCGATGAVLSKPELANATTLVFDCSWK
jgi:hypothetical protein